MPIVDRSDGRISRTAATTRQAPNGAAFFRAGERARCARRRPSAGRRIVERPNGALSLQIGHGFESTRDPTQLKWIDRPDQTTKRPCYDCPRFLNNNLPSIQRCVPLEIAGRMSGHDSASNHSHGSLRSFEESASRYEGKARRHEPLEGGPFSRRFYAPQPGTADRASNDRSLSFGGRVSEGRRQVHEIETFV